MYISWRDQLEVCPSYRDIKQWPVIPVEDIPRKRRATYLQNIKAVTIFLDTQSMTRAANELRWTPSRVSKLVRRSLESYDGEPPALTRALVPHARLRRALRKSPLDSHSNTSGHQHSFQHVLDKVPSMREKLDELLIARIRDLDSAQVATVDSFFGEFKRLLAEANWPRDQYPYTTITCAYESVRKYFHERLRFLKISHQKEPSRVIVPRTPIYRALHEVQIDAQIEDLNTTIHLELNDELIPLRISRVCLLQGIDVTTKTVLGYHLVLSKEPNQDDILQLIDNITRVWEPMGLKTPGLAYAPGSGFPSMWDGDFRRMTFGTVKLDNALVHMAETVRHALCDSLGATLNLGLPGMPKGRNWVEMAMKLANKFTHRPASTTGSSPTDPIRESRKNKKKPPKISLRTLEEALSIILAKHNITPRAELGGHSPLDTLRHHAESHYVRWMPQSHFENWKPFDAEVRRKVIFLDNEKRRPFVRFGYTRYSGKCLSNPKLTGTIIRLKFDRRDIRVIQCYTLDGIYQGEIFAPKSWQRFPHSIYTRRKIFKEVKKWKKHTDDPFAEYFHQLLQSRSIPKCALEIIRVYREATKFLPLLSSEVIPNLTKPTVRGNQTIIENTEETVLNEESVKSNVRFKPWNTGWTQGG